MKDLHYELTTSRRVTIQPGQTTHLSATALASGGPPTPFSERLQGVMNTWQTGPAVHERIHHQDSRASANAATLEAVAEQERSEANRNEQQTGGGDSAGTSTRWACLPGTGECPAKGTRGSHTREGQSLGKNPRQPACLSRPTKRVGPSSSGRSGVPTRWPRWPRLLVRSPPWFVVPICRLGGSGLGCVGSQGGFYPLPDCSAPREEQVQAICVALPSQLHCCRAYECLFRREPAPWRATHCCGFGKPLGARSHSA